MPRYTNGTQSSDIGRHYLQALTTLLNAPPGSLLTDLLGADAAVMAVQFPHGVVFRR